MKSLKNILKSFYCESADDKIYKYIYLYFIKYKDVLLYINKYKKG